MPSSITFRGTRLFEPSVVADVVNNLDTTGALGAKNLCVVGDFPILKPETPVTFNQGGFELNEIYPMDATLLTLDKIWKRPLSNVFGVSQSLTYVSANQSTQAQWSLPPEDAGQSAEPLTLKSTYYGTVGNDIRVKLDDPSSLAAELSADADYYKLTVRAPWFDADAEYVISGADQLQLTLADGDQVQIEDGVFTYTPSGQAAQTWTLADYGRMDELVAVLPSGLAPIALTFSDPKKLDVIDYTNGTGGQVTKKFHSHTSELLDTVNNFQSIPFAATIDDYHLIADFGAAFASPTTLGTSGGAPTAQNWSDALQSVENKDITSITILSTDDDHHELLQGHIDLALIAGRERNGFVGAPENTSLADIYTGYVLPRNDSRISVCGQKVVFSDHKAARRTEGPEYLAFFLMCAQGALPPAEPLTRKALNIFDTSESWDRERQSNAVASKSIVGVKLGASNELEVIRGLTSWRKDDLSVNCEISTKESIDTCVRELRRFLTAQLGQRITNETGDKVKALTSGRLRDLRSLGAIQDFRNIQLRRTADTIFIDFDVALIEPLNFIRITANIVAGQ